MEFLLLAAVAVLFTLFIAVFIFLKKFSNDVEAPKDEQEPAEEVRRQPVARRIINGAGMRRRQGRVGTRDEEKMDREHDASDGEVDDEKDEFAALKESGKIGTKKLKKLEEKAERRAHREAVEIERQEKKVRDEMREEQRKKQDQQRQQEEADKEAKEEEIRQEKKRQEEEEYQRLKEAFTVDEEGRDALDEGEAQNLLQEFITHIKTNKVIMLEDLAAKFHIKTQEVIDRVKTLQDEGELTGVMDDRGKFIYITKEEYEAVAKFIKQRGRVSIAELSESINQVICMDGVKDQVVIETH